MSDWTSLLSPVIGVLRLSARYILWSRPFVIWDTNSEPLSLCRDPGRENLRIISCSNALGTSAAISVLAWNASVYPENVSTSTRRYLKLLGTLGMTVKSTFQCSPGYVPLVSMDLIWELLGSLVLKLFIVQMRHVSSLQLSIFILFMPRVTMTSTDQLYKASFP